ncbi:hypothetical protein SLNWT_1492 [Streptomyces albus]|uniref:Extradiol ring-cleavage dioxygenase class III enzyme subunit B domain-containing protein n=1 Tax=Streptomyces albus (strain ATCC 21838 / DSM 41398 / FERM P-419 / JCM 4703 / NBRC 107858) TaxID=1081613 RepID=A0A0B5EI59_STRA4|nr:hypothetical protein SLNWT_1492 [Streptomyces albus]AOU76184.1 hypothetical protein SLNHY_1493 [Streptomyces albus]AYN31975.1 hypothetical protein DUI70_1472 [Streptomyces albus]
MLVAAAVCPAPPLLVPEVAAGAAPELDAARAACAEALGRLAAARPERLLVLGPADRERRGSHPQGTRGSFRAFGVDLEVQLGAGEPGGSALPPSLAVGAWLLGAYGPAAVPVAGLGVGEPLETPRCLEAGARAAAGAERLAMLVLGEGSACRTLKAPGYLDERATAFDAAAARALGGADAEALAALDAELAQELKAAGRAPWQVLAGAAGETALHGELLYEDAPYGVGYLVASWTTDA